MTNAELNLELRSEILERALILENEVNKLLFHFLGINKEITKTLSNKSSSLSFKNKIDLLLDLDRINKDEYQQMLLFMEIRNQFLHNISANDFSVILTDLGNDRINRLIIYKDNIQTDDTEYIYRSSFFRLFIHLLELISSKYAAVARTLENIAKEKIQEIDERLKDANDAFDILELIISQFKYELFPKTSDTSEIREFKETLVSRINIIITESFNELKK
jgi:hypothetical protein